jgi:hypothetical protein
VPSVRPVAFSQFPTEPSGVVGVAEECHRDVDRNPVGTLAFAEGSRPLSLFRSDGPRGTARLVTSNLTP